MCTYVFIIHTHNYSNGLGKKAKEKKAQVRILLENGINSMSPEKVEQILNTHTIKTKICDLYNVISSITTETIVEDSTKIFTLLIEHTPSILFDKFGFPSYQYYKSKITDEIIASYHISKYDNLIGAVTKIRKGLENAIKSYENTKTSYDNNNVLKECIIVKEQIDSIAAVTESKLLGGDKHKKKDAKLDEKKLKKEAKITKNSIIKHIEKEEVLDLKPSAPPPYNL